MEYKVSILIGLCVVAIGFATIVAGVIIGECFLLKTDFKGWNNHVQKQRIPCLNRCYHHDSKPTPEPEPEAE